MSFFNWDLRTFSVSVPEMDSQHEKLVAIVNQIYDASKRPPNKPENGKLLGELMKYTLTHFHDEEKYMKSIGYPQLDEHKAQHKELVGNATKAKITFDSGDGTINPELLNFLKNWLMSHIQGHDKKYGAFSKTKKAA